MSQRLPAVALLFCLPALACAPKSGAGGPTPSCSAGCDGGDASAGDPEGGDVEGGDVEGGDVEGGDVEAGDGAGDPTGDLDPASGDAAAGDADPGDPDLGDADPPVHLPPAYLLAFSVAFTGPAGDQGDCWVDLKLVDPALLGSGWRLLSASYDYAQVQMRGDDLTWPLAAADVIRFHCPDYGGSTDVTREENRPDRWDYAASGGYPLGQKHGIVWLEDAAGTVVDLVAYGTELNPGDWLSGDPAVLLSHAVAAGAWSTTGLEGVLDLGDAERNYARLADPRHDGDAAADWEAAGTASQFYYEPALGSTGAQLKSALNAIIKGHTVVPYADLSNAFSLTDRDPTDPSRLVRFYTGDTTESDFNREHVWAKSHGGFDADSMAGYSDLHHIRPTRPDVNSVRWHLDFDEGGVLYSNTENRIVEGLSFEPRDAVKGDVARSLFYMAVRYEGDDANMPDLELVEEIPSLLDAQGLPDNDNHVSNPQHGRLSTLLRWHVEDPPDAEERRRNEVIYEQLQHNRNPFIDHPEWVHELWGGAVWPW